MLKRLFKRKAHGLTAPESDRRLSAIQSLTDDQRLGLGPELVQLAQSDSDLHVRRAATERLDNIDVLFSLLDDSDLADAAASRLIQLDIDNIDSTTSSSNHPRLIMARIAASTDAATAAAIALRCADPETLAHICLKFPALRKALLAGATLHTEEGVGLVEKISRGHDKSLNRTAREAISQLRQSQKIYQQQEQRLADILDKINLITVKDPQAVDRYDALAGEFQALVSSQEIVTKDLNSWDIPTTLLPKLPPPINSVNSVIPADPIPTPSKPAEQKVSPEQRQRLLDKMHQLQDELLNSANPDAIEPDYANLKIEISGLSTNEAEVIRAFNALDQRHDELTDALTRLEKFKPDDLVLPDLPDTFPDNPDDMASVHSQVDRLLPHRQRLTKGLRQVNWPAWAPKNPILTGWKQQIDQITNQVERFNIAVTEHQDQTRELLNQLSAAIDEGRLDDANQAHQQISQSIGWLGPRFSKPLNQQLNSLRGKMRNLRDWKTFATSPKRQSLCNAMETLVDAPLDPPDQARKIKDLRGEWQALGHPASAEDYQLADRFNSAAAAAFDHCKDYFRQQQERRESNASTCELICQQLSAYLEQTDWQHADLKAAEKILRAARDEWRAHQPIPHTQKAALSEKFEKLQGELFAHLKQGWQQNLNAKTALVQAAQALSTNDANPTREKAAAAKQLQQDWQKIGPTPRKADQALWRDFRAACDKIFTDLTATQEADRASVDAAIAEADAFLAEFKQVISNASATTAEAQVLTEFRRRLSRLSKLDNRHDARIEKQFNQLTIEYQALLEEARVASQKDQIVQFELWEQQILATEEPSGEASLPHPWFETLEAGSNENAILEKARDLAILAELAGNLPSPPEHEARRMELQVERLNLSLREGKEKQSDAFTLLETWCRMGAPGDPGITPYRIRFFIALKTLPL